MVHGGLGREPGVAIAFSGVLTVFDNVEIETPQLNRTKIVYQLINGVELILLVSFQHLLLQCVSFANDPLV